MIKNGVRETSGVIHKLCNALQEGGVNFDIFRPLYYIMQCTTGEGEGGYRNISTIIFALHFVSEARL